MVISVHLENVDRELQPLLCLAYACSFVPWTDGCGNSARKAETTKVGQHEDRACRKILSGAYLFWGSYMELPKR